MIKKYLYRNWIFIKRKQFINSAKKKDVIISSKSKGFDKVDFEGKNIVPERCHFLTKNIKIGYATTLGIDNMYSGKITIGKYCQIGANVAIHATNHPISYMTTYINSNLFKGELKKNCNEKEVKIGNDVWIGHSVIIVGNVTVGDGAILAAGSVVTKNVDPYSIVAGNPAKLIRKRFKDSIILELQELKWWDISDIELDKIKQLFFKDFSTKNSIYE
jgi:virginiamycin A acetyltransferase